MVRRLFPSEWVDRNEAQFRAVTDRHDVNMRVVEAMIYQESRGRPGAAGDGGRSHGILQIMNGTDTYINNLHRGRRLERRDPVDAFEMASILLENLRDDYSSIGDNYIKMLRGYNAGPGKVRGEFSMAYAVHAGTYLAIMAHDHRGDPAEQREYAEALDLLARDAQAIGRGGEFRRAVSASINGRYGAEIYNDPLREGSREGLSAFRAGANEFVTQSGRGSAPQATRAAAPHAPQGDEHRDITGDRATVRDAQRVLGVDVDGIWGRDTQRAFQNSGADADRNGRISRAELSQLMQGVATVPQSTDARREHRATVADAGVVRMVQERLGFTGDAVDGIWGRNTQRAFEAWERTNANRADVTVNGLISAKEVGNLLMPARDVAAAEPPAPTPSRQTAPHERLFAALQNMIPGR